MKLLLVEDDKRFGQILKHELADDEHSVDLVTDGVEAVLDFIGSRYDIVLMDIRMPRLGGLDALCIIRRLSPGIPAIVFSAAASSSEISEAELGGRAKFLAKPFEIAELKKEILRLTVGDASRPWKQEH